MVCLFSWRCHDAATLYATPIVAAPPPIRRAIRPYIPPERQVPRMNPFVYEIPTKVHFGADQLEHLGPELARFGTRVLLTYGGGSIKTTGLYDRVVAEVHKAGLTLFELPGIEPNPRVTSVRQGAELCKREHIDVLLAVGGGSTIDCTKFISAAAFYEGDAWDLSTGAAPITQCLPIVSILTLSATGSEMDSGGVITNLETKEKLGNGHPVMVPKVSFLDPTNTYTVNAYQTACGAADIISHTLEVYCNTELDLEFGAQEEELPAGVLAVFDQALHVGGGVVGARILLAVGHD